MAPDAVIDLEESVKMKLRIYNDTLDPDLWKDDKTLNPEIRDALLKVAEDFYNSTELKGDIHNILFIGSSANYNWSPSSDMDLHIVIDIVEENINKEHARKFMDGLSYKWNTEHDIEIKGHPVEVYLQDLAEPNSTADQSREGTAIYSLVDDKWVLEPNRENIKINAEKLRRKYQQVKKQIKELIETEDVDKLKSLMKSIRNYRNSGLLKGGEFSIENLVFKALRHSGDLEKLKYAINVIYDKKASLPEDGNIQPDKKTEPLNEVGEGSFLITGIIGEYLHIVSKKHSINDRFAHGHLIHFYGADRDGKLWRYFSKYKMVLWYGEPTDEQEIAVKKYLETEYGITNARNQFLNEVLINKTKDFLIVGIINPDDLDEIKDFIDYDGYDSDGGKSHGDAFGHAAKYSINWRYKAKTTLFIFGP